VKQSPWSRDLIEVQRGRMKFDQLTRDHAGLIASIARPWLSRLPADEGLDDLKQETLWELWRAIKCWDPARGVPLSNFVRNRIHYRLLSHTHKVLRKRSKDIRYLEQQIIEEKVVFVPSRGGGDSYNPDEDRDRYISVTPPPTEAMFDSPAKAARVVGRLPSKQARVVVGVLHGEPTEVVTSRVYGSKCRRPRKAALRALSAAVALAESGDYDESDERTRIYATDEKARSQTDAASDSTNRETRRGGVASHAGTR